jgi:hypothetical protein
MKADQRSALVSRTAQVADESNTAASGHHLMYQMICNKLA